VQHLVDALRDATDTAPPTTIDLDNLIDTEYRRKRVRTGVGAVLVTAALAAVPLALTTGGGATAPPVYGAPASQSLSPLPSSSLVPTRQPSNGSAQTLSDIVVPRVYAMLPGATLTDPRTTAPFHFTGTDAHGYNARATVKDAAGTGHLWFDYLREPLPCATGPECDHSPPCPRVEDDVTCTVRGDGTKVQVIERKTGGLRHNQVSLYRPDGSVVQLIAHNADITLDGSKEPVITRPEAPLTIAQLMELADLIRLP